MSLEKETGALLMQHAMAKYHPAIDDAPSKTHAGHMAMEHCRELFKRDYEIEVINNKSGRLCSHYPSKILLLADKRGSCDLTDKYKCTLEEVKDRLESAMADASGARCWSRFVSPVILYKGRYVCRSATVAGDKELTLNYAGETFHKTAEKLAEAGGQLAESGMSAISYVSSYVWGQTAPPPHEGETSEAVARQQEALEKEGTVGDTADQADQAPVAAEGQDDETYWERYYKYLRTKIDKDIELLKTLNVGHIFDIMVENAKVKYNMIVSSSEKADEERRYKDFKMYSMPYPGCEFFAKFSANGRCGKNLFYNWQKSENTAKLNLSGQAELENMKIQWENYKKWDLIRLTKSCLQAMIRMVATGPEGVLVHCISGWDRTPLFISLLRLSLWADGLIHQSLEPAEILYLTLAYDWYLFGHGYHDRKKKEEEVLPFCFYFLPFIADEFFSVESNLSCDKRKSDGQLHEEPVQYVEQEPKTERPLASLRSPSELQVEGVAKPRARTPTKRKSLERAEASSPKKVNEGRRRSKSIERSPREKQQSDTEMASPVKSSPRKARKTSECETVKENVKPEEMEEDDDGFEMIEFCDDWKTKPDRWRKLHLVNWTFRNIMEREKFPATGVEDLDNVGGHVKPKIVDVDETDQAVQGLLASQGVTDSDTAAEQKQAEEETKDDTEKRGQEDSKEGEGDGASSYGISDYLSAASGMTWLLGSSGKTLFNSLLSGLRGEEKEEKDETKGNEEQKEEEKEEKEGAIEKEDLKGADKEERTNKEEAKASKLAVGPTVATPAAVASPEANGDHPMGN